MFDQCRIPSIRATPLYTVGNTIFDEKALFISASGPAGLKTFLEETENKEKIQNICLSGPLKAPGPLVTTLATPLLDGPGKALVESATPCHDAQCGALPSIEPCLPD